jgi:hypothetical protein
MEDDRHVPIGETAVVRTHQPGQSVFRSVLPEDIEWKPFPALPREARLAVIVGQIRSSLSNPAGEARERRR